MSLGLLGTAGNAVAAEKVAGKGRLKKANLTAGKAAEEKPLPFERKWLEPYFVSGPLAAPAEAFRREEWRKASAGFLAATKGMARSNPERAPGRFLLAMAEMNQGDWDEAGNVFEALYEQYPLLAAYHAHYAARCRLRKGDYDGALVWAKKVPDGAILEAETVLIELDALVALERFAEVEKKAEDFLQRFPAGPRRAEAMFRRAEAMEKIGAPAAEIAALYRRIWAEAPLEAWSRRAEERLTALVAKQPPRPQAGKAPTTPEPADLGTFTASEWLQRGMELFERNQNEDSEAAFVKALEASPAGPGSADLRCKAEFHRAQSIFKQRQRTRAAPFFTRAEAACREAKNDDLYVKSLYQGGRCYHNIGEYAQALVKYAAIEKEAPKHSYADDARLRAAEVQTASEHPAEAAALLSTLADTYPGGDQAGEAMWRMALTAIQAKDWVEANRWLDQNLERIPRESIWYAEGRALYWKARVALARDPKDKDQRAAALSLYTRAIREYPLSVYTFLAFERMRTEFPQARGKLMRELRTQLVGAGSKSTWQFAPRVLYGKPEFKRAVELARLGMGSDARREIYRLGLGAAETRDAARAADKAKDKDSDEQADKADDKPASKGDDKAGGKSKEVTAAAKAADASEDVRWITAILLDRGRSWAAAHAIPRYNLTEFRAAYPQGNREAMWRLAFPRAFPELVTPNSKANKVPEALQWAIMREESAFNPRIESFANALGLTQMLVKTARRFLGPGVSRETLLDPGRNVQAGSRLLSFLLERYHRKEPLAIASYNAGEGAVDRWLGERGDLELDEFLETIPYDETRGYTKRVLSSYLTYSWLYNPQRPVPELGFSLKAPPKVEKKKADKLRAKPAGRAGARRHR